MANRNFRSEYLRSFQTSLVFLEGRFGIGASGAVTASSLTGTGISSVTKLQGTGTYRIVLEDDYNRLLDFSASFLAPLTGSAVTAGSFVVGTTYQIATLGTTDYTLIGAPANVVGVIFSATGIGVGTGTGLAIGNTAVVSVEIANPTIDAALVAKYGIVIQCKSTTTALVNPTTGSTMLFSFMLRNSSSKGKGEV